MAVLVTPMGGRLSGDKPSGTDYEQLINYQMLYDAGDECSEVHGGLSNEGYTDSGYTYSIGTKNANNLYFNGLGSGKGQLLGTVNSIDLTPYSKLFVDCVTSGEDHALRHRIVTQKASFSASQLIYTNIKNSSRECVEIDVADVSESCYIVVHAEYSSARSGTIYHSFLTKADDITTLCSKAGVSATSLETLLADTTSLATIFNSEEAVKFMVKQCTGDFMVGVLNNEVAVGLLKESPYLNMVVANPHWAKFMMMLPTANELLGYRMTYDGGDECGLGWTSSGYTFIASGYSCVDAVKNTDNIYFATESTGYKIITAGTQTAIDLTAYSKVIFDVNVTRESTYGLWVGTNATTKVAESASYMTRCSAVKLGRQLVEFDVSNDTTSQYLMCFVSGNSNTARQAYLHHCFLTKTDNYEEWLSKASVYSTDLETLVNDSTAMATLMSNQKAVDYLAGCTGDLMASICNSEVAMSALCDNIAYDTLFKHPVWYKFMTMNDVSLSAMKNAHGGIPTMTSNTEPSGVVTCDSYYNTSDRAHQAINAFDKNETTWWQSASATTVTDRLLQYEFAEEIDLYCYEVKASATVDGVIGFDIQVSADGSEYETIKSVNSLSTTTTAINTISDVIKFKRVKFIRIVGNKTCVQGFAIRELQAYGKVVE